MNNYYASMSTIMIFLDSYDMEAPEYEGMINMVLKLKFERLFAIKTFEVSTELKNSRKKGGFNIIIVSSDLEKVKAFKRIIDGRQAVKWFVVGSDSDKISKMNMDELILKVLVSYFNGGL